MTTSGEERIALDAWWERHVYNTRPTRPPRELPHDGASWACYVLFFASVGMGDAQIKVDYVSPFPIMEKLLKLWDDAKKSKIQERK